jgi:DNA-binding XRE family transcriptional regulator
MPHFQPRVCCIPVDQVQCAKNAIANRTTDPVVIGQKLRQTRLKLGLTQGEMARLFDIPVIRWSAVENGMEVKL